MEGESPAQNIAIVVVDLPKIRVLEKRKDHNIIAQMEDVTRVLLEEKERKDFTETYVMYT